MKEANNARLQKLLQKQYRTKDGIKTYEEIINDRIEKGHKFFIFKEHDSNKRKKIVDEMARIKKRWIIAESKELQQNGRGSNYNIPDVTKFWVLFDELHNGCIKNIYFLGKDNTSTEMPKMIYDFYNKGNQTC